MASGSNGRSTLIIVAIVGIALAYVLYAALSGDGPGSDEPTAARVATPLDATVEEGAAPRGGDPQATTPKRTTPVPPVGSPTRSADQALQQTARIAPPESSGMPERVQRNFETNAEPELPPGIAEDFENAYVEPSQRELDDLRRNARPAIPEDVLREFEDAANPYIPVDVRAEFENPYPPAPPGHEELLRRNANPVEQ